MIRSFPANFQLVTGRMQVGIVNVSVIRSNLSYSETIEFYTLKGDRKCWFDLLSWRPVALILMPLTAERTV